jgi:hypothetical protein
MAPRAARYAGSLRTRAQAAGACTQRRREPVASTAPPSQSHRPRSRGVSLEIGYGTSKQFPEQDLPYLPADARAAFERAAELRDPLRAFGIDPEHFARADQRADVQPVDIPLVGRDHELRRVVRLHEPETPARRSASARYARLREPSGFATS